MSMMTSQQAEAVERWLDRTEPSPREMQMEVPEKRTTTLPERPRPAQSFHFKSFARVCSLNLCSAIFGLNIVLSMLVKSSPTGGSILDSHLYWIISIPVVS